METEGGTAGFGSPSAAGQSRARGASGHRGRGGFVMRKAGSERWETRGGDCTVPGGAALDQDGICETKGG